MKLGSTVPILRSFDEAKAKEKAERAEDSSAAGKGCRETLACSSP